MPSWRWAKGIWIMKKSKKKEKEAEKNPLHVEYGVLSNIRYMLKNIVRAVFAVSVGIFVQDRR